MAITMTTRRGARFLPSVEPNVIPFIDVLLVLLIIFMVTAPKPTVDLKIDLPQAGRLISVAIPPLIVDLRPDPRGYAVFLGERELALSDLSSALLAQSLAFDPVLTEVDVLAESRVYVRAAEQSIAYGAVVTVLDELQSSGFQKVGIFAQAADEEA